MKISNPLLDNFLSKSSKIAVIGASNNPEKYGFRIFNDLKSKGFKVYPVNHKEETIVGEKCYKSFSEIQEKIDIYNFVVPPVVTNSIIQQLAISHPKSIIWLQDGSWDNETIKLLDSNNLNYVNDKCIMVATNQ